MILEKSFPAMGTVHTVTLFDAEGPEAASDARAYLLDLHRAWSCFKEDSLVSRINQAAGRQPVAVDEDTFEVLRQAKRYGRFTEGAFDVTVGPLADLWRRAMEERQLPGDEAVWQALALVNFANVTLDEEAHTVLLEKAGQRIDLGGIAKGYVADRIREYLEGRGVKHAILSFGGNIVAIGLKPDGSDWKVGIQDIDRPTCEYMLVSRNRGGSTVTSGIYERGFDLDGVRYHHILSPENGMPVQNELASVTIFSENSMEGDALSTTAFILGTEKGTALIDRLDGIEAVFISRNREVTYSSGARDWIIP